MVKGEFAATELACRVGIDAAEVELTEALGRDALLIERFDREPDATRRGMVSRPDDAGTRRDGARYASYADLADI